MKNVLLKILAYLGVVIYFGGFVWILHNSNVSHSYRIEYTRCNTDKKDTVIINAHGEKITIDTYREAVPVLRIGNDRKIVNVCDYRILDTLK